MKNNLSQASILTTDTRDDRDTDATTTEVPPLRERPGELLCSDDDVSVQIGENFIPDADGKEHGLNKMLERMGSGDKYSPSIDYHPQVRFFFKII